MRFGLNFDALNDYLAENNPQLWSEIGEMDIFEGTKLICERYGLSAPAESEDIEDGSNRILAELKEIEQCKGK